MKDTEQAITHELDNLTPQVVELKDQLSVPGDSNIQLPFNGLICQSEFKTLEMSIIPTPDETQRLIEDKGIYPEDREKYLAIVKRIHEDKRVNFDIQPGCSLEDLLKFCTAAIWLVTGDHDEKLTNERITSSGKAIRASELIDLDNPPPTKCSFFNSAYSYLFEAACVFFKREDLLQKYQMIAVQNIPTHLYLGLVSKRGDQVRISAIDPYHTGLRADIQKKQLTPDELFSALDQTENRGHALQDAYKNAINWDN